METFILILLTAGAVYYLYRQTFVSRGCDCGDKGCCKSDDTK